MVKAAASIAAPGFGRCRRRGDAKRGDPSQAHNLGADIAEGVGEDNGHHRQAPKQECSDAFAEDHYHGLTFQLSFDRRRNPEATRLCASTPRNAARSSEQATSKRPHPITAQPELEARR